MTAFQDHLNLFEGLWLLQDHFQTPVMSAKSFQRFAKVTWRLKVVIILLVSVVWHIFMQCRQFLSLPNNLKSFTMLLAPKVSLSIKFHFLVSTFSFPLAPLGYKPNGFFVFFFHLSDKTLRSPRSHLIFCFYLNLQKACGKLYLVDLAGSKKVSKKIIIRKAHHCTKVQTRTCS